MGGQVSGDRNEGVAPLIGFAPFSELPYSSLEHLVGVKPGILAQQRARQRRYQIFGGMTE